MNLLQSWQEALLYSWDQVWTSFAFFLPSFLGAVVIFVVGLFLASWANRLVMELVKVLRLEDLSVSSGFSKYLQKAEIKLTATEIIGEVVRWILLLVFFIAAVEILGLTVVSNVLYQVLAYVPNVIAAALIFGVGFFIANIVEGLVRGAFASVDHEAAKPVGRLARWVVLVVAFFAAVDQLRIAPRLMDTFFQGLTWTFVLVFGLSIGLGSKDLVAKFLEDWYKKLHK